MSKFKIAFRPLQDIRMAWVVWALFAAVASALVLWPGLHPRSVTHTYRSAALHWFQGEDLYTTRFRGFVYLPQAALLYSPLAFLPLYLNEIIWRFLCLGLLAGAVWRLAKWVAADSQWFPLVSYLTIPMAADSARNGQMNLPLAALMVHVAVDLAQGRWWLATLFLCLGMALKPLMAVMILLSAAAYPRMIGRLALGLAIVGAFPFLWQDPAYVGRQYGLFLEKMRLASSARPLAFGAQYQDLFGLLSTLGVEASSSVQWVIRLAAAAAMLALSWLAVRRWASSRGPILLLALSACYLLLFNPRAEGSTYVLVAPLIGIFTAEAFLLDHRPIFGWAGVALIVGLAWSYQIVGRSQWLMPTLCLIFLGYVIYVIFSRQQAGGLSVEGGEGNIQAAPLG
jgi:hypothetical protein